MARKFEELRAKMPKESQERAKAAAEKMLAEMALTELRQARSLTQQRLADILNVNQAAISKMERRTDMYISTLRDFVVAMGGALEIRAHFPDGDVRITQFRELDEHQ